MGLDKPRVCVIRRAYYPAESHVRRNAESLVAAGYLVELVCLRNQNELAYEVVGGVNVHRLPLRAHRVGLYWYLFEYSAFFLLAIAAVTWLHFWHHFEMIEADSMPDLLIFTGLVPRLTGSRLILYLFESMPELWAQKNDLPMDHCFIKFLLWQERFSCRFAHAVICCHEMAQDSLVRTGIPQNKIVSILNVPDEATFFKDDHHNSDSDGIFRIIQHGTITENYGIQIVIQALSCWIPSYPSITILWEMGSIGKSWKTW